MPSAPEATQLLELGAVFTLLFVTMGPLKVLGPFARLTHGADEATVRQIAVRAFALGLIAAVAGGFIGLTLLRNWSITIPTMLLAGGIIFFLVALSIVLDPYQPAHAAPAPLPASPMAAAMRITFPTVVTPYGVAAVIILLANSPDTVRTVSILVILLGVMVLNLLAMLFARWIMDGVTLIAMQILGAVLAVMQLALAIEMVFLGLRGLRVLN